MRTPKDPRLLLVSNLRGKSEVFCDFGTQRLARWSLNVARMELIRDIADPATMEIIVLAFASLEVLEVAEIY